MASSDLRELIDDCLAQPGHKFQCWVDGAHVQIRHDNGGFHCYIALPSAAELGGARLEDLLKFAHATLSFDDPAALAYDRDGQAYCLIDWLGLDASADDLLAMIEHLTNQRAAWLSVLEEQSRKPSVAASGNQTSLTLSLLQRGLRDG